MISLQRIRATRQVHVSKENNKMSKKKKNNSQKVTFNTAVADLRVLCVQMRKGD